MWAQVLGRGGGGPGATGEPGPLPRAGEPGVFGAAARSCGVSSRRGGLGQPPGVWGTELRTEGPGTGRSLAAGPRGGSPGPSWESPAPRARVRSGACLSPQRRRRVRPTRDRGHRAARGPVAPRAQAGVRLPEPHVDRAARTEPPGLHGDLLQARVPREVQGEAGRGPRGGTQVLPAGERARVGAGGRPRDLV